MDFSIIVDFVTQQGIWCALFVWLFYTTRQESQGRENRLMEVIEQHSQKLVEISESLARINEKIDDYHNKDKAA